VHQDEDSGFVERHQPPRVAVGQRIEEDSFDGAENGDIRTDAESHDDQACGGQPWVLAQPAKAEAKILPEWH
jgi:hypothetical protein